ncbi:hypothetical protein MasN3_31850 [Massilia varians]|uniref:Uncharacterized protein n=1 Tax=Massilia varians TaxID=457921 RepID=A0ABM8C8X4_9BURK|nr:hypothetical protein [Massilia varians]BDT59691.1 hypothetical protein MasN3_31850 [Massilia varians]
MSKRHAATKRVSGKPEALAATLLADARTRQISKMTLGVFSDTERLVKVAQQRAGTCAAQAQGWQFEQLEVIKFNLDALGKRSTLKAATTDSLGMTNHETADIVIMEGKRKLKEFQLKSCEAASETAYKLSDPKYQGVGLVGPSDQKETVERLYKARIKTGTLKAGDYESASNRLHTGIEADNVTSGGTNYHEAVEATGVDAARKIATDFNRRAMLSEAHQAGMEAGAVGGALAGGVSGVAGLVRLARGNAEPGEILAQVAIDAAKGYTMSYASGALSKAATHAVREGFTSLGGPEIGKAVSARFVKSNAHVALAAGIVQSGRSLARYLNGDIDEDELLSEVSHTAMTGASAFYYGALGQVMIPVPVVGALIGSTVGYFVGNMLHQSGLISLGETAVVKVARERKERVEAMCLTAIPLMRAHRLEFDALIEEHFATRRRHLLSAFDALESAMVDWDGDRFLASLTALNEEFDASLPFGSQEEFDDMMGDPTRAFVL